MKKTGRNDPCPCGSGRKYKQCCQQREAPAASHSPAAAAIPANLQAALEHRRGGRLAQAQALYRQILDVAPDHADALHNLGTLASGEGKYREAAELIRRAIRANPSRAMHYNLGNALKALGDLDGAAQSYRQALALKPDYAEAYVNLGNVLYEQGQLDEAIENFRKALLLKPDLAQAHYNLGNALYAQNKLGEAAESYRRTITRKPDFADAHNNLGLALQTQGALDAAIACYRQALALKPDYADAHSNLLFLQGYHALLDPLEYLSRAKGWEQACLSAEDRQAAHHRTFQRLPPAGRRLKIGYVSGDYRQHAVSCFVEQLFTHHDRSRVELFAYSNHSQRDAVTERLQALVDHWIPVSGVADAALRERIEADGVDVLIDLSGHTAHNRLGVFALRAAPVQAYYLGYFASTGLTEMDYWIGDETLTPVATDHHFSEQVWRLPRISMSYAGKTDAPLPVWPSSQDGTVRVGSFNNLGKLTPATLALWAQVLQALPQAGLLLKTRELADGGNRRRILEGLAAHGIAPDRVELQDGSITPGWPEHMAYYRRLDIALDPVGGHGGVTTTCDALWMGAPVVTLMGDRVTSRMTASMLHAIGHPEWIARSAAEYVDKVSALARDVEQRKLLRLSQRDRMAHSPLCDARGLAASLEQAYLEMFERWQKNKETWRIIP